MRVLVAVLVMLTGLFSAAHAQDDVPWQATVTGQIEALRAHDGEAALTFAGTGFRTQFEGQPDAFYAAILETGYEPITASRSHSFGEFQRVSDTVVMQVVKLIGSDQGLYEAMYQLVDEPDEGWRVAGVALRREPGVGI